MLMDDMKRWSMAYINGEIEDQELVTKLILALGEWRSIDDTLADLAFAIADGDKK